MNNALKTGVTFVVATVVFILLGLFIDPLIAFGSPFAFVGATIALSAGKFTKT